MATRFQQKHSINKQINKRRDCKWKGDTHKKSQWLALKMPTLFNRYHPKTHRQIRSSGLTPRLIFSHSNLKDQQRYTLKYRIYSNKDPLGHLSPNLWNQETAMTALCLLGPLCTQSGQPFTTSSTVCSLVKARCSVFSDNFLLALSFSSWMITN